MSEEWKQLRTGLLGSFTRTADLFGLALSPRIYGAACRGAPGAYRSGPDVSFGDPFDSLLIDAEILAKGPPRGARPFQL
jgi:hypothetical protein